MPYFQKNSVFTIANAYFFTFKIYLFVYNVYLYAVRALRKDNQNYVEGSVWLLLGVLVIKLYRDLITVFYILYSNNMVPFGKV